MEFRLRFIRLLLLISVLFSPGLLYGNSDWPMWRNDPGRSAFAEITLPDNPVLLWTRQLEEPKRCWPFQFEDYFFGGNPDDRIGKLSFDISYEPVVGGGKLFVPSMVSDRLTAYSADNGEELWRYYAGGPVRFAPVYDGGRVYFVSDDGYLYCLDAATGDLLWNYHGSYSDRLVLGNERIISMWPARGGPVISNGIIYFSAGVMPYEGTFIHAVDAVSGDKVWTNSTSGSIWGLQQHSGAYSYGGPSPQGYLAVSGDKLIVPSGRIVPAVYDINTGELLYFIQSSQLVGNAGGYRVFASDGWFFNHGMLYALEDGAQFGPAPGDVITSDAFIGVSGNDIIAHKSAVRTVEVEIQDRLQRGTIAKTYELEKLWEAEVDDVERLYFKTASHFAVSKNGGSTAALVSVSDDGMPAGVAWEQEIDGEIWSMFAAGGRLYIVSREGKIYCYGAGDPAQATHHIYEPHDYRPDPVPAGLANSIIARTGVSGGYGLVYGGDDPGLIKALVDGTSIHFVVVEPDAEKVEMLRRKFDDAGLYGRRVSVINSDPDSFPSLPYIFELAVLNGDGWQVDQVRKVFNSLRPYGGTACFTGAGRDLAETFSRAALERGKFSPERDFSMITRQGALPGSGQWTHQYASAANRTYSDDYLVRPPLGVLWFGGPSNLNVLPRHSSGPVPQVAGGRLIILGVETISARCVYTGRELWVREIPGIGHPFTDLELEEKFFAGTPVYMTNQPGANVLGSPYISLEDIIYVIDRDRLLSLEPATGDLITEFRLPPLEGVETSEFGHIMVWDDFLITTVDPQVFDPEAIDVRLNWNHTSSSILLVLNRKDGNVLWAKKAGMGFRHNAIAAGNGMLFMVDGLSEGVIDLLRRRGLEPDRENVLMALDIKTGETIWQNEKNVFGTWLGYYEDKNILIQAGRHGGKRNLRDEPDNLMLAHHGNTGEILWEYNRKYSGSLGLHPDMIIPGKPGETAIDPLTGNVFTRKHPIADKLHEWSYHRYYGCGTMNSSRYLITFRSATAAYTDLLDFGGTSNLSGFKAGCTNNLVAADGVLNAPDYTRTCTCAYPLQTSIGFVHMPGAGIEFWALNRLETGEAAIRSLGINFGAQGNRSENGVLWLEYPKVYAAGPNLPVNIESDSHEWFRNHATWIENREEKYDWVASYGAKGITSVTVDLVPEGSPVERSYNVTLYFAEPEDLSAGDRVFDVSVQGEKVLGNFDIARQAGGSRRIVRKEFADVRVKDKLHIEFTGIINSPVISGVEIVMNETFISGTESGQR